MMKLVILQILIYIHNLISHAWPDWFVTNQIAETTNEQVYVSY